MADAPPADGSSPGGAGVRGADRRGDLALLAAVAVGAGVRLVALGRTSFWLDEAYGVELARQPLTALLTGHVGDAHTPPLYYVLLHLWMRCGDSDAWLRGLSAVFSIAVLALAAGWLARRFETRAALLGTTLLALSPYQVYFAQEARMYSLATLLALTVFLLEERAARDRRPVVQLALLAAGAAGLYAHYYLAFVIAGSVLVRAGRLAAGRARGDTWRRLLVTHVAMAALFAPWLTVVGALAVSGGQQFHQSLVGVPAYAWFRFLAGYAVVPLTTALKSDPVGTFLAAWPWLAATSGLGLLGVVGLWRWQGRHVKGGEANRASLGHAARVVAMVFAVPFAISLAVPMYGERYLGIVQPLVLLLLTAGLLGLPRRLAAVAVSLLLAVSLVGTARWTFGLDGAKEDSAGAVSAILAQSAPGDAVVLDPPFASLPVRRYLRPGALDIRTAKSPDPVAELGDCRTAGDWPHGRLWVVLSHSPRAARDWQSALEPCAELAALVAYPAGVGITVLRFEAVAPVVTDRR